MLSAGTTCYHLGLHVIIWDAMLSSGANVIIWDKMVSSGANVIMVSSGTNIIIWCYHVMLSSGMITHPFFIFPENFTHSRYCSIVGAEMCKKSRTKNNNQRRQFYLKSKIRRRAEAWLCPGCVPWRRFLLGTRSRRGNRSGTARAAHHAAIHLQNKSQQYIRTASIDAIFVTSWSVNIGTKICFHHREIKISKREI